MPTEDMGFVMGKIVMPGNAPRSEIEKVGREVQDYLMEHESERIKSIGVWYSGNNVGVVYRGQLFVVLKDWAARKILKIRFCHGRSRPETLCQSCQCPDFLYGSVHVE